MAQNFSICIAFTSIGHLQENKHSTKHPLAVYCHLVNHSSTFPLPQPLPLPLPVPGSASARVFGKLWGGWVRKAPPPVRPFLAPLSHIQSCH